MFEKGDDVFPCGPPPRACVICGQYERGRGWRMGYAKSSHGRMHVKEGTAKEVLRYERYEFVLTASGVTAAESVMNGDAGRCKTCGRVDGHARDCLQHLMQKLMAQRGHAA